MFILGAWLLSQGVCLGTPHWVGVGTRVTDWQDVLPADRVRLGVRDEGVYRVSSEELARASGKKARIVLAALNQGGLSLTCQGRTVAWTTDGTGLYFYGVPTKELYAPENVYWLTFHPGVSMERSSAVPEPGGVTNEWFMHTEHYRSSFIAPYEPRDRRSTNATLTNVLNFGEWVPSSADEVTRTQSRTLMMPRYCAVSTTGVTVRVELASYRDFVLPDTHTCEIRVNGISCGEKSWTDEQAVTFDYAVPAAAVTNGVVMLSVRNAGGTTAASDFMILEVILIYPRGYVADGDILFCMGGVAAVSAAGGFETGQISVWDVTDAATPVELLTQVTQDITGMWQTVFNCGDEGSRYAVFARPAGCFEPSVSGVRDVDWSSAQEMPELAIIAPPQRWVTGFAAAVQPLADFRNAQGLRTRVIDAEAVYNAFTHGIVHPEAFRRFSGAGVTNAEGQSLRYLLFAGHGGSDYKLEVFRLGELSAYPTLFPLYLFSQVVDSDAGALLLPNDLVLGDVTGGATPELAVGRLIATSAEELSRMITKSIRYELTETWKRKAVFSADWDNVGSMNGNFDGIAAATASGFPTAGWFLKEFYPAPNQSYLGSLWIDTYYGTGVHYELQEGAGFFYYIGHSSETIAGNSGPNRLFNASMLQTGNWPFAPVALLMGCRMGRWTALDMRTHLQAIAEAGVRNPYSGFAAVISSSGYMTTPEAAAFSYAFRNQVAAGALRLGDVMCGVFAEMGDAAAAQQQHMALLGDPSLCIRADRTARGTPSAWLIEQGLTGDPYADLADQDGDGFSTWLEAQAGTSPVLGGLRFRSLSLPQVAMVPGNDTEGIGIQFEPMAGENYRVMSTSDLMSGTWMQVPWRPAGSEADWSFSAITGDWPLRTIEVPYEQGTTQQFYKIETK